MRVELYFLLTVFSVSMLCNQMFSQSISSDFYGNLRPIFETDTIVYFGLDLSKSRLTHKKKMEDGELIKNKFCKEWQAELLRQLPPERDLRSRLKKELVEADIYSIQRLWTCLPNNWIIDTEYRLTMDQIRNQVASYKLVHETGIGLVAIVENMNKHQSKVFMDFAFFNIKTRELYWVHSAEGDGSGAGLAMFWNNAFLDAYESFLEKEYPRKRGMYKKYSK